MIFSDEQFLGVKEDNSENERKSTFVMAQNLTPAGHCEACEPQSATASYDHNAAYIQTRIKRLQRSSRNLRHRKEKSRVEASRR